ncbi:MAG TPA: hypothetical protein VK897_12225 [Anaerolineales bacterium]|nr:hypothetical protein [Anaerolineales bacterium]
MYRSTLQREKRLAELKKEVNRRGFDRHASVLRDVSELPAELQSQALADLSSHEAILTIVAFPPQIQRGWNYVPRQALLFTATGVIHILASIWPGEEPQTTSIMGRDLLSLRVTLVLLYGFIEMIAQGENAPMRVGMEFNTVAWPCLSTPVRQLLQMTTRCTTAVVEPLAYEAAMQQSLDDLPLKFSNGAKIHGRLPGQSIETLSFQPSVQKPWLHFLRRKMWANTLLMLTTDFMVIIQEELNVEQGWVLTYIPRECIIEIQNHPRESWNELALCLQREDQTVTHIIRLGSDAARNWQARWIQHGGRWRERSTELL